MDDISIGSETAKSVSVEDVPERLDADPAGLSGEEARRRRGRYGPNEIREKHVPPLLKFLRYFWGPIPGMIEVAAVKRETIDLVLMTAHDEGRLEHIMFGRTTDEIVRRLPADLLLVKEGR